MKILLGSMVYGIHRYISLQSHLAYSFSAGDEATYIGCYVDQATRALSHLVHANLTTLALYSCLAMCKGLGYTYAGTYL